jgi:pimeloyl-ACP methyl ester carboxylesterase
MKRIPSETDIPGFSDFVLSYKTVPRVKKAFTTTLEGVPCQIAMHQLGDGNHNQVLVLVHGVLSDHETWRYVAGDLSKDYDVWLVDLPGCGDSEAPNPNRFAARGYSPTAMAERVLQALDEALKERHDSPQITLVGHSLGGLVCLQMAGDPWLRQNHPRALTHLASMVLLAPADASINQENPVFVKIAKLRGYEVGIARALGILSSEAAKADLAGVCSSNRLGRETALNLERALGDKKHRQAAQAMIRQAVFWKEKQHRPNWAANQALAAHYRNVEVPCLILWGEQDETLPESMGHKIKDSIRGARLITLRDCMHSPHLEHPDKCLSLWRKFLQNPGEPLANSSGNL